MYYNITETIKPEEILIYLRKSRSDDPQLSTEEVLLNHENILDGWVERNLSAPIPQENRFKEVISGGESISERPEFQKVLKLIESPKIKAVMVKDISRLGRPDTEEIGRISKIFRLTKTLVITPERIFDIADGFEREMFEQELKRSAFYLDYTKKILKDGRELSVKSGNYVCSTKPYGYKKIKIVVDKKKCPTLDIIEEEANILNMMSHWYIAENIGTQIIADRLNEMGVKAPKSQRWTAGAVRNILENPLYIGKIRWNTRKAVWVVENGVIRKTRPINTGDDYIYVEGKHPAIWTEEQFNAHLEKRGKTHRTCDNKELRNPLASLLYCECGRAMSYRYSTRDNSKYGEPRLVCNGQKYCGNGSCSVDEMVHFVTHLLRQKITEFEVEAKRGDDESNKYQEKQIKSLEKKLADIDAKELSLWEAQIDNDTKMPSHIFSSLTEKLTKEREDTENALAKARAELTTPIDYEKKIVTLQAALDALGDNEVSVADKNHLLKKCIDKVTYHREPAVRLLGKGSGKGYINQPIDVKVELNV